MDSNILLHFARSRYASAMPSIVRHYGGRISDGRHVLEPNENTAAADCRCPRVASPRETTLGPGSPGVGLLRGLQGLQEACEMTELRRVLCRDPAQADRVPSAGA